MWGNKILCGDDLSLKRNMDLSDKPNYYIPIQHDGSNGGSNDDDVEVIKECRRYVLKQII